MPDDQFEARIEFVPPQPEDREKLLDDQREDTLVSAIRITGDAASLLKGSDLGIALRRNRTARTEDVPLWVAIRNRTRAIAFDRYAEFLDRVLCGDNQDIDRDRRLGPLGVARDFGSPLGVDAYNLLKAATQAFLLVECGVVVSDRGNYPNAPGDGLYDELNQSGRLDASLPIDEMQAMLGQYLGPAGLPYIHRIVKALGVPSRPAREGGRTDDPGAPYCANGYLQRFRSPCLLELIWSYWHEEGMLVQSVSALALRFQNKRSPGARDPLAHLELDPLRPLNNLIWGYIQDEYNRLTVARRAYEYDHHYGISLVGRAVPALRPADSRSKFIEAFHDLLMRTARFYQEDAETTVISNAFPLLNGLREVHLVLAEGAHNQFGDLPWTARVEMLIQQFFLARPETGQFLAGRTMVPYPEPWMGRVDTMKTLQGWTDVSVTHFHHLAVYGEQILLSIRYGDWVAVNNQDQAKNWARYWRPEIEGYLHAYRAATGVDLVSSETVDATPPSVLLQRRLQGQARGSRSVRVTDGSPRPARSLPASQPRRLPAPLPPQAPATRPDPRKGELY